MAKFRYTTDGTCSTEIRIELDGGVIRDVQFAGGCTGNLRGLSLLLRGMDAAKAAGMLEGIQCRNGTSCPDQLSKALRQAMRPGGKPAKPRRRKDE